MSGLEGPDFTLSAMLGHAINGNYRKLSDPANDGWAAGFADADGDCSLPVPAAPAFAPPWTG
jgi:hypothetical protein